ncbi:MAG: amidophosphoribosyltransferase [Cyclobacteriaceae bacterium]|nr:MAG: amidophosphoribosyltransferase [Cyclobacteriaceae bacterium]
MSDAIKHECGIALIRLRKPLQYYIEKYDTPLYAVKKLYLLMEKQHNRGQDGAGVANIKLDMAPGKRYISRYRSVKAQPILDVFSKLERKFEKSRVEGGDKFYHAKWLQANCAFSGEVWMGHLRYGTHGGNKIENCHPMLRQNNWRSRNLVLAGNFNMTNLDELFDTLVNIGQHPKEKVDTVTVLEKIGHFLDEENQRLFDANKEELSNQEISEKIELELNLQRVLQRSCKDFDGGYAMVGMIGNGASFVVRDPVGIRPAYYYADDEVIVAASEKPAIKTAFNVDYSEILEIEAGKALIINKQGAYGTYEITKPQEKKSCSFERIYFSRGSDPDIYNERKDLGRFLVPPILRSINFDLKNTVFSYIPNTAETAFLGMIKGLETFLADKRKEVILESKPHMDSIEDILNFRPRIEKLVLKDAKLRTFITDDVHRDDLVAHVYDTTYEVIRKQKDTVVVIDDSIVRGTTLEVSILAMLMRLEPKKIVIVSSAPQIRYPDCYGIDMSRMKDFIAFRAVMELLEDNNMESLIEQVYQKCAGVNSAKDNYVKELYQPFKYEELSQKIAQMISSRYSGIEVEVIYQTVEDLNKAIPKHLGDWYFTGNYPTPGGNRVVNQAFVNYMQGKTVRAY